jgi:ornithine cyclodeaminase/alanine dehydrogenase-like protein (mu-crystallin family)
LKRNHDLNDHHTKKQSKDEKEMTEWLGKGNVIYKSVGIGLMDLVVGMELVKLARKKKAGTVVKGF